MPDLTSRIYVGVDPSLRSTGIAFISSNMCVTHVIQPEKLSGGIRLKYHVDTFLELAGKHSNLTAACIEGPALYAVNRADDAGQIRGIFLYALAVLGIPVVPVAPKSLKQFATGSGNATKENMLKAAQKEWPQTIFKTDDAADAAWLAAMSRALHEDVAVNAPQLAIIRGIRTAKQVRQQRLQKTDNL